MNRCVLLRRGSTVISFRPRSLSTVNTTGTTSTSRQPLPPMPRVMPPKAVPTSADTTTTTKTAATAATSSATSKPKKRGGVLIATGWIILGLLGVDQVLQYMDRTEAKKAISELQQAEDMARKEFFEQYKDKPILHECIVKFEYKMSGTRGLKGVSLNDRLEVLEEGVGPNGTYATCRRRDAAGNIASIGWYPLSFMEKVEKKPRKKFLGMF